MVSAVTESACRLVFHNSGRESERAISADSGALCNSIAKHCLNLFSQRYPHNRLQMSDESYASDISDGELLAATARKTLSDEVLAWLYLSGTRCK